MGVVIEKEGRRAWIMKCLENTQIPLELLIPFFFITPASEPFIVSKNGSCLLHGPLPSSVISLVWMCVKMLSCKALQIC